MPNYCPFHAHQTFVAMFDTQLTILQVLQTVPQGHLVQQQQQQQQQQQPSVSGAQQVAAGPILQTSMGQLTALG